MRATPRSLRMKMKPALPLLIIMAVALGLRLYGARTSAMMFDESTHLAAALTIDLHPDRFNAIPHSVDHPPLSVYVVRVSTYIFGTGLFGMRALHAIAGALTVLVLFFVARPVMGPGAALAAAGFLAVDQFHVTWSYFAVPEVLLLLFAALTLQQYVRILDGGGLSAYIGFGVFLGLSYLAKESAIFIVPALWLGAAADSRFRQVFRSRNWYLAHVVALAVVLPEVLWNVTHFYESYYYRDASMVGALGDLSPRAFLLYLRELVPLAGSPFTGGFTLAFGNQSPSAMHWPAGLFYLGCGALALLRIRDAWTRLFLVLFAVVFAEFTLLPDDGFPNYWWASLTLLPAVLLAGPVVRDGLNVVSPRARRTVTALVTVFFLYLLGRSGAAVDRQLNGVEFISAEERARAALERAEGARSREELLRADVPLYYAVLVTGGRPDLYYQLSRVACGRAQFERARYFAARTLTLDPDNAAAGAIAAKLASTAEPTCE